MKKNGDELVISFCNRLKMPNVYKKSGLVASREHMKAGLFNELKLPKKVDFLVKNYRNPIGLRGLEIIANCDKIRDYKIEFSSLGDGLMKEINGDTISLDNLSPIQINNKLRTERIKWLSNHL